MKRNFYTLLVLIMAAAAVAAEGKEKEVNFVPVLNYEHISLDKQTVNTPGAGFILTSGEMNPETSEETDNLIIAGFYRNIMLSEQPELRYPDTYHTIDMFANLKKKKHQYLLVAKSDSNEPFNGIRTYQAGLVYGYEFLRTGTVSLVFGGGLAAGYFGIESDDGDIWPVIPVPLIRFNYDSDFITAKFEFLTNPNLDFVIAPQSRIRLKGDLRMDQFRDERDLFFDFAVDYRLVPDKGDFAGISAGIKNDGYNFDLHDGKEKTLDVNYYAAYAGIDLSFLQIQGGYAFEGREMYREKDVKDYEKKLGEGFFISAQCMYRF